MGASSSRGVGITETQIQIPAIAKFRVKSLIKYKGVRKSVFKLVMKSCTITKEMK